MLFKNLKISQKLYLGFAVIILLMLAVLAYTYISFQKVSRVVDINLTTYKVLQESDGMLTNLIGMETSSRGYTITGDERYLESFENGKTGFQSHYAELKQLISKNSKLMDTLAAFDKEYRQWLSFETEILDKKKQESGESNSASDAKPEPPNMMTMPSDEQDAAGLVRSGKGRNMMSVLQEKLDNINSEERKFLKLKSENLIDTKNGTYQAIFIGGILLAIIAALISFFTSHSITKPLKMLTSSTESIIKQKYLRPVQLSANKDLDCLIENFNEMQLAIQARETELQRKNDEIAAQMIEINEATRLKSQFLANMSHELRTPLNSIIGFTARVIRKCREILPPAQLDNLEIVKNEANHLLDLINDLLDYSKLEAGKMALRVEAFDLAEVIEEVNNLAKPLLEGKPQKYIQELYTQEGIYIDSDRQKVKQIMINLVSNAIKYSENGIIKLSVEKLNDTYCIKVEDEGIGIAPENLVSIFDEFRQVDGSYARKAGGTGLGLSITRKYVEMLKGRIEVKSTLGLGSCFTIYLPATMTET